MMGVSRRVKIHLAVLAGAFLVAGLLAPAALAQIDQPDPRTGCDCQNSLNEICTDNGYKVKLLSYSIDQNTSVSSWDYQICNEAGLDTTCTPNGDLLHAAIGLPLVGDCLDASQDISVSQTDGFGAATLSCTVMSNDPQCVPTTQTGRDYIAQCDVVNQTTLDPGECVTVQLNIAGEMPTLGPGQAVAFTRTDTLPDCPHECIMGPSCFSCQPPPPPDDHGCLTRTKGFWGTHPAITNLFKPISVCGYTLDTVNAGSCSSITEAVCVAPGKEAPRSKRAYANLVKQLAAAKLNLAATASLGGTCGADAENLISQCEGLCGASGSAIKASGCIQKLTDFNESFDTVGSTVPPFASPGPANPEQCQAANGNGIVIGLGSCK